MGTPGSPPQPVTEVLVNIIDYGMHPKDAAARAALLGFPGRRTGRADRVPHLRRGPQGHEEERDRDHRSRAPTTGTPAPCRSSGWGTTASFTGRPTRGVSASSSATDDVTNHARGAPVVQDRRHEGTPVFRPAPPAAGGAQSARGGSIMRLLTLATGSLLAAGIASGQTPPDARDALYNQGPKAGVGRRLGDGEHPAPHRHRDPRSRFSGTAGNAIDAFVTAVFLQNVVDYHQVSLFGAMGGLYYDAATGNYHVFESYSERPLAGRCGEGDPSQVAIGGKVAGLGALADRYGTKEWSEYLEPAITAAEEGGAGHLLHVREQLQQLGDGRPHPAERRGAGALHAGRPPGSGGPPLEDARDGEDAPRDCLGGCGVPVQPAPGDRSSSRSPAGRATA